MPAKARKTKKSAPASSRRPLPVRWIAFTAALATAGGAFYFLASGGRERAPLDEIDDLSRAALDRVIDRAERRPPADRR